MATRWDDARIIRVSVSVERVSRFHVRFSEVGMPPMCCWEDVDMACATNTVPDFFRHEARDWEAARFTRGVTDGWRSLPFQTRWLNWVCLCWQKQAIVKRADMPSWQADLFFVKFLILFS